MFLREKRDDQRFRKLAYPHLGFLYNMALRYAGNTYDAEDMVQETLYAAFKNFHQLRDENKCRGWLFAILRRTYLKQLRQSARNHEVEYSAESEYMSYLEEAAERLDAEKVFETKVQSSQIHDLLNKMSEKYRSPVLLYYMEDMSYQDISDYLEIPIGTVMSRLARGKELLKKEMLRLMRKNASTTKVVAFRKTQQKG